MNNYIIDAMLFETFISGVGRLGEMPSMIVIVAGCLRGECLISDYVYLLEILTF